MTDATDTVQKQPAKPSYKSLETYLALAISAVGLAATAGLFSPDMAELMKETITEHGAQINLFVTEVKDLALRISGFAGAAAATWKFIHDRSKNKRDGELR